MKVEEA